VGTPTQDDFWRKHLAGWHVLAAAALVLVGAVVLGDSEITPARRALAVAIVAALGVWYAVVGASALAQENERRGTLYLAGVLVAFPILESATLASAFLLFSVNPQVFAMVRRWSLRIGLLVVLYSEIAVVGLVRLGVNSAGLTFVAVAAVIPFVVAVLIGAYITGIIVQSRQRADLIDELTRTRTELARERHEAGVNAERTRLANEIHDTLAQGFASILMLAQAARAAVRVDPDAAEHQLDLVERAARENLDEARTLVAALAPPDLADSCLAEALSRLADRHTRDTGVPVTVTVAGTPPASLPETDAVLLRAAQEALANVRKHAHASTVHIELSHHDGAAAVAVRDDGCGFDPTLSSGGYGLSGLRTRATAFGGRFEVRSAPGAGTTIRVELP
jgi:signal transduction histidine kinase